THLRDQEARREQLVATLSHELRTPLTSQRMAVELLERALAPLQGRPKDLVAAVRADVGRLEDVAQRLLDVSRSRAMSIALVRARCRARAGARPSLPARWGCARPPPPRCGRGGAAPGCCPPRRRTPCSSWATQRSSHGRSRTWSRTRSATRRAPAASPSTSRP